MSTTRTHGGITEPPADANGFLASSHSVSCLLSLKIHPSHLERLAYVYVRQSRPQQIVDHRESRELQYALAVRAVGLGWPRDRVIVLDEDTGTTVTSAEHRSPSFQAKRQPSLLNRKLLKVLPPPTSN